MFNLVLFIESDDGDESTKMNVYMNKTMMDNGLVVLTPFESRRGNNEEKEMGIGRFLSFSFSSK